MGCRQTDTHCALAHWCTGRLAREHQQTGAPDHWQTVKLGLSLLRDQLLSPSADQAVPPCTGVTKRVSLWRSHCDPTPAAGHGIAGWTLGVFNVWWQPALKFLQTCSAIQTFDQEIFIAQYHFLRTLVPNPTRCELWSNIDSGSVVLYLLMCVR